MHIDTQHRAHAASFRVSLALGAWLTLIAVPGHGASGEAAFPAGRPWEDERLWKGNQYGIGHYVPPPWTPIKVKREHFECWGRQYAFTQGPFPARIQNQQQAMLTRPMQLVLRQGGKDQPVIWEQSRPEVKNKFVDEAFFRASGKAANVEVSVEGRFQFDGSLEYTVAIAPPEGAEAERLALEIPLKSELIKFYHYQSWAPAAWHVGCIPPIKEQVGVVKEGFSQPFRWIIWFGDEERSLVFYANSPKGWLQYRDDRAFEIERQGDTALLRINFGDGDKSFPLSKTSFKFALNTTPVKALPSDWRRWTVMSDEGISSEWFPPDADGIYRPNPKLCDDTGSAVLGGESTAERAAHLGFKVLGMHWTTHYPVWGVIGWGCPIPHDPAALETYVRNRVKHNVWPMIYQDTNVAYVPAKALMDHFEEWSRAKAPEPDNLYPAGSFMARHWNPFGTRGAQGLCSWSKTRQDWMVYTAVEAVTTYPWMALYEDEPDPFPCFNPKHQHKFKTMAGKEVQERDIFGMCEQWKRIYKEVKKRKPEAMLLTDHNSPCYPFFDVMMMGEGEQTAFGLRTAGAYRKYYTPEDFRYRYAARQWGMIPIFFPGTVNHTINGDNGIPAMEAPYNRELIAWTLLHDMTYWPVHCNAAFYFPVLKILAELPVWEAEFHPYWQQKFIHVEGNDKVLVSCYRKGDRLLAVLANTDDQKCAASIRVDRNLIAPGGRRMGATDAEEFKPVYFSSLKDGVYETQIPIDAGDFRLLLFWGDY